MITDIFVIVLMFVVAFVPILGLAYDVKSYVRQIKHKQDMRHLK